ncbi:MAG: MFS transporter [Anaerolineales bacterium]|nr:MFS transporter [Anaerolineales bacterium]
MNHKWIGFSGILVGMCASALMQTLVATSLPVIERDLGGMQLYSWVFGGYMLASTVTIPLFARLADVAGRRTLFINGMLVFLLGSALVGLSQSMAQLVAFRVVQGIGAGAVAPAALASIGDLFGENERGKIFGVIGAVQVLANLIGPPLGGWVTDTFSWHWGFYLVLPLGAVAIALAQIGLPNKAQPADALQIDWLGAFLIGAGLCVGLVGFQWIGLGGNYLYYGIAFCVGQVALLVCAVFWEQHQEYPVISIDLLGHPLLWRAALGTLLLGFVTNGALAYFPLYLEKIHGLNATATGLALLPILLMAGVASGIGGALASRWKNQTQAVAWILVVVGFSLLTVTMSGTVTWMAALIGAGMGLLLPVYLQSAQQAAENAHLATASGLIQMARNMGGAMGIPLLGIWLTAGEVNASMFASIFATLTVVGALGLLLGLASPQRLQRLKQAFNF